MANSDEERSKLPLELLTSFAEAQTALAGQKYRDALTVLLEGLDQKYDSTEINPLDLLNYFRGLLFILEFYLRRKDGIDWQAGIPKIPEKDTRCSFCGGTCAEVAKLITGTEGNICDECVGICNEILADD
jgi:hypothetical protein